MKICILLLLLLLLAYAETQTQEKLKQFKKHQQKQFFNLQENIFGKTIFYKKLKQIEIHNKRYTQDLETSKLEINNFFTFGFQTPNVLIAVPVRPSSKLLPASVDWRVEGVITPIKNQQTCGSCWAFSTTGTLEAHYAIYYKQLVTVSEQQLVDCAPQASGCSGGWMTDAFMYIAQNGGINYDRDYPYRARDGTCLYKPSKPKITVRGYAYMKGPDEELLKDMVAIHGPVSVAIDAGGDFARYSGGVYYNPLCSSSTFTHAVVIVGYGTENGHDYWLIKNSWGTDWGLNGYLKMARNKGNNCGIASKASYPLF